MVEIDFVLVIAKFISGFIDFIYPSLALIDFILVLRIILLVFFFVYFYRIIRDFFIFSGTTSFVIAAGLIALLELTWGLFGYLASTFSGIFLFIGGLLGSIVAILVGLIILLMFYYFLMRIGWGFKKRTVAEKEKKKEREEKLKEIKGKAYLRKIAESVSTAGGLAEKASRWGTLKHVAKKVSKIGERKRHEKRGSGGRFIKK